MHMANKVIDISHGLAGDVPGEGGGGKKGRCDDVVGIMLREGNSKYSEGRISFLLMRALRKNFTERDTLLFQGNH